MKKWLALSLGIVLVMAVVIVAVVRAVIPSPIPDPPSLPDAPLAIHINEIDLSTAGLLLVSIDNQTREPVTVDVARLGAALSEGMRLFDPIGNEWVWLDERGRRGAALSSQNFWQWNGQWNGGSSITIEPGRSENVNVSVVDGYAPAALEWVARLRGSPEWFVYVIDCELPAVIGSGAAEQPVRITAKGEVAYRPRP